VSRLEIFVRHDAELDAFGYFQRINQNNPEAATRFLAAIDRTVERLGEHPFIGRIRRFRAKDLQDIRSWRVDDFENYLIFYRVTKQRLEVLRIKHGAMNFPRALRPPPE
jgi:toxin ParE1/3/4